jgi:uncharacterized protein (DUF305 family)
MALYIRSVFAAAFCLSAVASLAQPPQPATAPVPIVQPGAPGKPSRTLTPEAVRSTRPAAKADVDFMQGMIMHHSQAVEMVDLLRTRGKSPALMALGEKITLSQSDEIKYMKQWLTDRGQATTMNHSTMMDMSNPKGSEHKDGMGDMLMPGMLTPEQMTALARAKGAEFDHLFLTGMIQHHTGALIMVDDLFKIPGAGQDPVLFDFATDIDNTQTAEIKIMRGMLDQEKK